MPAEVSEEPLRRQPLLPESSALMLRIYEVLRRETIVKLGYLFCNPREFAFIDPHTIVLPLDIEIIRQHAIRINENGNPATAQSLIHLTFAGNEKRPKPLLYDK